MGDYIGENYRATKGEYKEFGLQLMCSCGSVAGAGVKELLMTVVRIVGRA